MKEIFSKKKITALAIIIVILAEMFSPYSILLKKSQAAVDTSKPLVSVVASEPFTLGSHKLIKVTYAVTGENVQTVDLSIGFDKTKIAPANKKTGAAYTTSNISNLATSCADYGTLTGYFDPDTHKYTAASSNIRFTLSHPDGKGNVVNLADEGYTKDDLGEDETYGHDYYMDAFTLYFYLVDESITELTTDMLYFSPVGNGMPTGYKYIYNDGSTDRTIIDLNTVSYDGGFATDSREVESISVKTPPTTTTYDHGDTVNLAGGVLTVKYDNGDEEDLDMTDSSVKVKSGTPADVNNPKVTLEYKEKTVDVNLTVNDPVDSLTVTSEMTKKEYSHDEGLDFAGLVLTATKRSGATVTLSQNSTGVTTSETVASIDSPNFTETSSSTDIEKRGSQLITFTYEGKTTTQTIIVNDHITGINVTSQPTKTIYKRGESIDLTGAVVTVSLQSGDTTTINLPGSVTVDTYNPNTTGSKQNLGVSLTSGTNTFTSPTTIDVEAYNYITEVTVNPPTKDVYKYGESLSLSGGNMRFTWQAGTGAPIQVQLSDSKVTLTGYSATTVGPQTIRASYDAEYTLSDGSKVNETITGTFNVEVENPAKSIKITAPTDAITFDHGDTLTFGNGKIDVEYYDGTHNYPTITNAMVVDTATNNEVNMTPASSEYDTTTHTLTKTLKITYEDDDKSKTATYTITLNNPIDSISIGTEPQKTFNVNEYETNQTPGGTIIPNRKAGDSDTAVAITSSMVSGLASTSAGTGKTATVTYEGKTTTYTYDVVDSTTGISIQNPPTTSKYGSPLDLRGIDLSVTKGSGTTTVPATSGSISGFDPYTLGKQKVKLTYDGQETEFDVTVQDYVEKITLVPDSTSGVLGTSLADLINDNNLKYQVKYASETTDRSPVLLTTGMVAGYNPNTATQNLTVTYKDEDANSFTNGSEFTATLAVTLSNNVQTINITQAPTTQNYKHGEAIKFDGAVIELVYENGETGTGSISNLTAVESSDSSAVDMTPDPAEYQANNNKVAKSVKVIYTDPTTGKTADITYNFNIINDIQKIEMHTTPKTAYKIGESLDLTTDGTNYGEILVTRAVGTPEVIGFNDNTKDVSVTGFDSSAAATNLPLTVKYTENGISQITTYNVKVENTVVKVEFEDEPIKTEYQYGDSIELSGLKVKLTYADKTTGYGVLSDVVVTESGSSVNMSPAANAFDSTTHKAHKTVDLSYTDAASGQSVTGTYEFDIIDTVQSIKIHTTPKTSYNLNEALDLTGGELEVYRASNPTVADIVQMKDNSNVNVTNFENTGEHVNWPLTVEYTENGVKASDKYNIEVIDIVSSVTVQNPPTEGKVGEPLNLSGTTITVTKGSGTLPPKPATDATITGYDPDVVGTQTVTVSYGGKSDTFDIVVKDYVTGIKVSPKSVSASIGDTLSDIITANNMEYKVTYMSAGDKTAAALVETMVSSFDSSAPTQTLTVTYTDNDNDSATKDETFTDTFTVTLANSVTDVEITGNATKTTYKYGESIDLDGITVGLTYANDTTGSGDKSDIVVTEADGSLLSMSPSAADFGADNTLTKEIKLTYTDTASEKSAEKKYEITIINDIQSIAVHTKPKDEYNVKDSLDITGGEIAVYRAADPSTPEIIGMNAAGVTVGGFDSSVEETSLPITVKYEENGIEKTTSYNVSVTDSVTEIVIKTTPKQDYKYNEPLDLTNGKITVTRGSGPEDIEIKPSMVKEADGSEFDPEKLGTRPLTITYGGKSVTYDVTVKDYVTGIKVNPDTVTGKYNDELATLISNNSIEYVVTYAKAGDQSPIVLDTAMVTTAYDKTKTDEQTLTIKYTDSDNDSATKDEEFTAELKVTLVDEISDVQMENTPKTNYEYGDELDVDGGTIKVTQLSGEHSIPITKDMVTEEDGSPFDPTNMTTRNLKVTYGDKSTTYQITITDAVDDINFKAPDKITYNYGEPLDLAGGYVQKVMKSGAPTAEVPLTDGSVQVSGYDATQVGAQTVTVEYEGKTFTYGVTVNDGITSIEITSTPSKTSYLYGDALETSGGEITIHYAGGRSETKAITPSMVTGYDPNTLGNQTLTVEYQGLTDTYNVNVEDYVDHIEIVEPDKLTYGIGESLDLTGGTVKAVMASGQETSPVSMSNASVSGFDSSTEGVKTITVTYQGKSKTFGVTVSDETTGWTILSVPNKLTYRYGEGLDLTGAKLQVTKESGATEVVTVTSGMVSGYNPNRVGTQTLTVTYEGETKDLTQVTVEDYIKKLNVKSPTKTTYHYGDDIDLAGGTVSVVMASGAIDETVPMTASMISGYDSTSVGTQTIPVEYKGLTGSFSVKVVDEVKGISLNSEPNKTDYDQGDSLDVSGGTITVVKDSGVYTIPITKDMTSGYNANTPGKQVVVVTYGGKTTTFVVNVNKKQEEEKPQTPSNTSTSSKPGKSGRSSGSGGTRVIYVDSSKSTPSNPQNEPEQTPSPEQPKEEEKREEQPKEDNKKPVNDKPIRTLGEKDEKDKDEGTEDKGDWRRVLYGAIIGIALLLLLLLLLLKRNVKVYVQEDRTKEEFVLGGLDKLKKKNPKLDIDKFLDEDTYPNKVKVVLNDSISEKLDGKEIEITHRGRTFKHKVKYEDKPYTFFLY